MEDKNTLNYLQSVFEADMEKEPEPPPRQNLGSEKVEKKYLTQESQHAVLRALMDERIFPDEVWVLPFEAGELEEGRLTIIVIGVSAGHFDKDAARPTHVQAALKTALHGLGLGRISTFITWDALLHKNVPNLVLPKYLPAFLQTKRR